VGKDRLFRNVQTAEQRCATLKKSQDTIYAVRGSLKSRTARSVTTSMTAYQRQHSVSSTVALSHTSFVDVNTHCFREGLYGIMVHPSGGNPDIYT